MRSLGLSPINWCLMGGDTRDAAQRKGPVRTDPEDIHLQAKQRVLWRKQPG